MPITHAAHATPIAKADYEATHVGSPTIISYGYVIPDGSVPAETGAMFFDVSGGWMFINVGTYASPDWKPLGKIVNVDAAAGFYASGNGSSAVAGVFGSRFEINTGDADHVGTDFVTGEADPNVAPLFRPTPTVYIRRNDAATDHTEIWVNGVGGSDTVWKKVI